jgi:uncharacterized C2H2 Zn-finger protein
MMKKSTTKTNKTVKLTGLKLICKNLATTKLNFTTGVLHNVIYNENDSPKCVYCAEGVLLRQAGVPKQHLDQGDITDVNYLTNPDNFDSEMIYGTDIFTDYYGIDIEDDFEESVRCPTCGSELDDFNGVIIHMNDDHSHSHKETAKLIKEVSEIYDIEDGTGKIIDKKKYDAMVKKIDEEDEDQEELDDSA